VVLLSEEHKASLFDHFLSDKGLREVPKEVTSRDGVLSLPATPCVARISGQKSWARKTQTQAQKKLLSQDLVRCHNSLLHASDLFISCVTGQYYVVVFEVLTIYVISFSSTSQNRALRDFGLRRRQRPKTPQQYYLVVRLAADRRVRFD